MHMRCDSHSGHVGCDRVSDMGKFGWIEGGWSKSWRSWRGGSGGSAASGRDAGEDQQGETSQTSVHAGKPEEEGGNQEWRRRARLEVGVMGRAGREQGKGHGAARSREQLCRGLCWTFRWKRNLFVFKIPVQRCGM